MMSVEQAIRVLRRDVLVALASDGPLPGGVALVADRVSITLGVRLETAEVAGDEPVSMVVATEPATGVHQVTVEFRMVTPSNLEQARSFTSQSPRTEPPVLPIFEMLAEVFGAPGFDSAARATVFREALDALTEAQRVHVLTTLEVSPHSKEEAAAVSHARQLVRRIAASGPAGQERGSDLLRQLATRVTVGELMAVAAERWRTQSEWTAAVPTGD